MFLEISSLLIFVTFENKDFYIMYDDIIRMNSGTPQHLQKYTHWDLYLHPDQTIPGSCFLMSKEHGVQSKVVSTKEFWDIVNKGTGSMVESGKKSTS